jgi:hypothetical protein
MFYTIKDIAVNRDAVDWIEWRKERSVLHMGSHAMTFALEYAGQVNLMAEKFIRDHNNDQVNPAKIQWAEKYPTCYSVALETSIHTIIDEVEIAKLEAVLKRRGK